MRIVLIGINHRTAPVALREKFAVMTERLGTALDELRREHPEVEAVLLSTCNRTELYICRPAHQPPTPDDLRRFLARLGEVDVDTVTAASIHREQAPAVHHLFRVSAGLDSMVLGEPQVLGQVRRAYESAIQTGTVGPTLHRVFQQAIATAKRVRAETGIDAGRVSVASVAAHLAGQLFDDLADKTVVGIGAGDIARSTLRHLQALVPGRLWVVNRSPERAAALAAELHLAAPASGVRPWEDLDELLVEADIILTGTASPEPVLTAARLKPLIRRRRNRPLFLIDMAVPRDVEPAVASLRNIYLHNIDDLQSVVNASFQQRQSQVDRCESELVTASELCLRQIHNRDLGQLVRQLRHQLHDIGHIEQQRTQRKLAGLTGIDDIAMMRLIDEHTHRVINKILHLPLSQLDHKDPDAPLAFYAAALRRLFNLEDDASRSAADVIPESPKAKGDGAPPAA